MKTTASILIFLFLLSCQKSDDSLFDCYLEQYSKEQRNSILKLHNEFEKFLAKNYPMKTTTSSRLKSYCSDLINTDDYKEKIEYDDAKLVQELYHASSLDREFRNWEAYSLNHSGLYFQAQRNCLSFDTKDSLIYNYLRAYDLAGDTSPTVFVDYVANDADLDKVNSKMLQHHFIVEYFVPRMKVLLPNTK